MAKSNLTLELSFDQHKRQIRRELFIQRQAARYSLKYLTEWTRTRQSHPAKAVINADVGNSFL